MLSLCAVFSRPSILSRCNPRPPTWSSRARRGPSHTRRVRKGTFFCLSSSPPPAQKVVSLSLCVLSQPILLPESFVYAWGCGIYMPCAPGGTLWLVVGCPPETTLVPPPHPVVWCAVCFAVCRIYITIEGYVSYTFHSLYIYRRCVHRPVQYSQSTVFLSLFLVFA